MLVASDVDLSNPVDGIKHKELLFIPYVDPGQDRSADTAAARLCLLAALPPIPERNRAGYPNINKTTELYVHIWISYPCPKLSGPMPRVADPLTEADAERALKLDESVEGMWRNKRSPSAVVRVGTKPCCQVIILKMNYP